MLRHIYIYIHFFISEKLSYVEGYENNPDYMVGMDKMMEDYDKFYDYDYASEMTSGIASLKLTVWRLTMAIISLTVCKSVFS